MNGTPPLALYIHWPFCKAKCPYCDFNSHVRESVEPSRWTDALLREMDYWRERTGAQQLGSIFFGGGTPSLIPPGDVARLIAKARDVWRATDDLEITLEANPTSSEAQKFRDFAAAGVNRLSLGVQALDDAALKFLGREHSAAEALAAVDMAANTFPRFSFDLIYARKGQTPEGWEAELKQALNYAGTHLSLYQLTIEPGTVFAQKTRTGSVFQVDDDVAAEMYERTNAICTAAGLPPYEVSNYAKPGAECRHNLAYWHYHDYVGIGAGAHGRVTFNGAHHATETHKPPEMWVRQVEEKGHGLSVLTPLTVGDEKEEAFMMGLRLFAGIDKMRWHARFGVDLNSMLDEKKKKLMLDEGLIAENQTHFRATAEGMMRLNSLTAFLLKDQEN